ncbi:hypothetical protein HSX11_05185 [Oxalobacteraceae bacterium]|nr:hypothetical protein [Oxalobacteraceae bacterium]
MTKKTFFAIFLFGISGAVAAHSGGASSGAIHNNILQIAERILERPDLSSIEAVASELGISVSTQALTNAIDSDNKLVGKTQKFSFLDSRYISLGFKQEDFSAGTFVPVDASYIRAWISISVDSTVCPLKKTLLLSTFENVRIGMMYDATPPVYYLEEAEGEQNEKVAGFEFAENDCLKRLGFSQNMQK